MPPNVQPCLLNALRAKRWPEHPLRVCTPSRGQHLVNTQTISVSLSVMELGYDRKSAYTDLRLRICS